MLPKCDDKCGCPEARPVECEYGECDGIHGIKRADGSFGWESCPGWAWQLRRSALKAEGISLIALWRHGIKSVRS